MKVTDTYKRVIKFEDVSVKDNVLLDDNGTIAEQLIKNLPQNTERLDISVTVSLSEDEV